MISLDASSGTFAAIWRADPCAALYQLAKSQPGEAVRLTIGSETLLIFQDAPSADHMLRKNPENYLKNFGSFVTFFGSSRLTTDGDQWRNLQRLSQPLIAAAEPRRIVEAAEAHFSSACEEILAARDDSGCATIDRALDKAAASVVADVVLGFNVEDLGATAFDDFRAILRYCSATTWNFPGSRASFDQRLHGAAQLAKTRLETALTALLAASHRHSASPPGLIDALRSERYDGADRFGEICTLLFAGFDTSASALGWSVWLLAIMPKLQERLRTGVAAGAGEGAPMADRVRRLPELVSFLNEALRIFPPIPLLSRTARDADKIGEHAIAAGDKLLISTIGLHHDRRVFANPARVMLRRFADGEAARERLQHFIPFGAGQRTCGGSRFAMTELPVALMVLLDRLRFILPGDDPLRFDWCASLRRQGGHRLKIEPV